MCFLVFCIICIVICVSIFGWGIGLLITVPAFIIVLVISSFISGPKTRDEELRDEISDLRDEISDLRDEIDAREYYDDD